MFDGQGPSQPHYALQTIKPLDQEVYNWIMSDDFKKNYYDISIVTSRKRCDTEFQFNI